jgi:predicted ferric reductase
MSDDLLKATVGRGGRIRKDDFSAFAEPVRDLGEDLGEWAIYVLLGLLALTLWKRFPYRAWRPLHRAMPVLYLVLAFHAVVLSPVGYWDKPVGLLMAVLLVGGTVASVLSLTGRIGRGRQVNGRVLSVDNTNPEIVEVRCCLGETWRGHRPGQFAFVTFDSGEGAHPFTIASADRGDRTVTFAIKALGDYTRGLSRHLVAGSRVCVEGPYGRFQLNRADPSARQIWIAGGIGITPFLAWLESLQSKHAAMVTADLHYFVRDRTSDPFVNRLQALCAALPDVRMHLHDGQSTPVNVDNLAAMSGAPKRAEVWFCGPRGLGQILRDGLHRAWGSRLRFHQEAFEIR